ncbi:MAG: HlyC/CorC family transporter [Deltaproteobacteria bacterium]|nr:HlyC/CorC family transporter [Deltaproteobacteria bacterium]
MLALYVFMALFFSFLCSIAEAVLLSITPSYIEGLKEKHPGRAALLQKIKKDQLDRSLAAILTLNTIAHTVGAIGAGAKATAVFGSAWFGFFSALMTLMILFLSEIVPKTIGAVYWSKLVGPTSLFVKTLVIALYPVVWVSERLTRFISHGKTVNILCREELIAIASLGAELGQVQSKESLIIKNLLRLESLKVTDIMTPRTVVTALPEDIKISEALEIVSKTPFSRIPVYESDIDDINGFVLKDDVLISSTNDSMDNLLMSLKRHILIAPDTISLTALFERFLKDRQHIAVVVNEHGGTEGLVTLEDIIETIMGMEIVDETDNVEDMRMLARKQWAERVRAMGIKEEI